LNPARGTNFLPRLRQKTEQANSGTGPQERTATPPAPTVFVRSPLIKFTCKHLLTSLLISRSLVPPSRIRVKLRRETSGEVLGSGSPAKAQRSGRSSSAWPERHNHDELSGLQHAVNLKLRDEATFWAEYQNERVAEQEGEGEMLDADEVPTRRTVGSAGRCR